MRLSSGEKSVIQPLPVLADADQLTKQINSPADHEFRAMRCSRRDHGACQDRVVRQSSDALASIRCASARSTEPIGTISTAAPREPSTGTMIMVATRR